MKLKPQWKRHVKLPAKRRRPSPTSRLAGKSE